MGRQAGLGVTCRHGRQCHDPQCQFGQVHALNCVTKHTCGEGRPVQGEDRMSAATADHTPSWAGPQPLSLNTGTGRGDGVKYKCRAQACRSANVQECW